MFALWGLEFMDQEIQIYQEIKKSCKIHILHFHLITKIHLAYLWAREHFILHSLTSCDR